LGVFEEDLAFVGFEDECYEIMDFFFF